MINAISRAVIATTKVMKIAKEVLWLDGTPFGSAASFSSTCMPLVDFA